MLSAPHGAPLPIRVLAKEKRPKICCFPLRKPSMRISNFWPVFGAWVVVKRLFLWYGPVPAEVGAGYFEAYTCAIGFNGTLILFPGNAWRVPSGLSGANGL